MRKKHTEKLRERERREREREREKERERERVRDREQDIDEFEDAMARRLARFERSWAGGCGRV